MVARRRKQNKSSGGDDTTTPNRNATMNATNNSADSSKITNTTSSGYSISSNNQSRKSQVFAITNRRIIMIFLVLFIIVVTLLLIGIPTSSSSVINTDDPIQQHEGQQHRELIQEKDTTTAGKTNDSSFSSVLRLTQIGTYKLLQTVPHDSKAFTQGLITISVPSRNNLKNTTASIETKEEAPATSYFIEGTGMYGESDVRLVHINNGTVIQKHELQYRYFGEGITQYTYYNNTNKTKTMSGQQRLIQITWKDQTAFLYDITMNPASSSSRISISPSVGKIKYKTTTKEGWGITYRPDRHVFYVSDGSNNIHVWDATTFQQLSILPVYRIQKRRRRRRRRPINPPSETIQKVPVKHLNELEWDPITQTILSNIWYQDSIIRIDPTTGYVQTVYDLRKLYVKRKQGADCLNGIALTTNNSNEIWVTGKYWPKMFRIQLIDPLILASMEDADEDDEDGDDDEGIED